MNAPQQKRIIMNQDILEALSHVNLVAARKAMAERLREIEDGAKDREMTEDEAAEAEQLADALQI